MSSGYASLALTAGVRAAEGRLGSARAITRFAGPLLPSEDEPRDALTAAERRFVGERDGFHLSSTGNITGDDRVSLFFMDYGEQLRLKVFGRARIADVRDRPELAAALIVPGYRAVVEQVFTVTVAAYDWNCQQHITPRYTLAELRELTAEGLP